jgi:hypothetical protein
MVILDSRLIACVWTTIGKRKIRGIKLPSNDLYSVLFPTYGTKTLIASMNLFNATIVGIEYISAEKTYRSSHDQRFYRCIISYLSK